MGVLIVLKQGEKEDSMPLVSPAAFAQATMKAEGGAMFRIRFHGRGGHGVKTASRIVGAAGFLQGLHAQDAPIYGAERRGAAVAAFTWLSEAPIRERGPIGRPDLLVIADETLLNDPASGVLAGMASNAAVFLNSDRAERPESLASFADRFQTLDVTGMTRAALGRAQALSAGLSAAAARLSGLISPDNLVQAVRDELAAMGLQADDIERNVMLARDIFARLQPVAIPTIDRETSSESLATIQYEGAVRGAPSILAEGNSSQRKTGTWRVERPVVDASHCTRCGLCFVQCPDGAIALDADGYPVIDYDHCKGCLICGHVCPVKAIHEERETKAW